MSEVLKVMIAKKKPKKGATAGMGKLTLKMYENVKQTTSSSSSCATLLRSNQKLISRTQLRIERAATGAKNRRRNGTASHEEGGSGQARNARTGAIDPIRSQTNH